MHKQIPVAAVIATRNRPVSLGRTLASLANQSIQPANVVLVDASTDDSTKQLCERNAWGLSGTIDWQRATETGAAAQRNEGVSRTSLPFVLFLDDDVILEPNCIAGLWAAVQTDNNLGGVSALLPTNRTRAGRAEGSINLPDGGGPAIRKLCRAGLAQRLICFLMTVTVDQRWCMSVA